MSSDNKRDKDNNSNKAAKAISAKPIVGIVVAVTLVLSGLSTISSYHPVFAQIGGEQNMTQGGGGNATTGAMGENATGAAAAGGNQSEVMMHLQEVRTALQNNDVQGAMMHLDLAMGLLGGSGGGAESNMTSGAGSTNSTG